MVQTFAKNDYITEESIPNVGKPAVQIYDSQDKELKQGGPQDHEISLCWDTS